MTQPAATAQRPTPPAKNTLPAGVTLSRFWKETPGGHPVKHDHERPVVDETDMPIGVWWMCPDDTCPVGEWVFPRDGQQGRPKKPGCPDHVLKLHPGRADAAEDDPKRAARNWMRQRMAEKTAAARKSAADAANARIAAARAAGREEAARLRADLREHVPSAAVSLAALVGDWALLENLDALQAYATGTVISVGMVLAYWTVYVGELVWARRMGYTIKEMPRAVRQRAMSRARWIAAGVLSTGVWLIIGQTIGASFDNVRGIVMNLFAAVLIGVVNYNPWAAMVQRRQDAARVVREAAEIAARAEEERLAAIEAERRRRQEAAESEARKVVDSEDDHITAGRKFAQRWQRIVEDAQTRQGAGFEIWRTEVVVEETRKLTARVGNEDKAIGWEFLIRAEPGVLAPRGGNAVSPFLLMKTWLASMLELSDGMLDLAHHPKRLAADGTGEPEPLINHGLITLFDSHPLGENVKHPGASGVYIDRKGTRWGFAGLDLHGNVVHRRMWTPGQAGGGVRIGVTGMGKSVATQVTAYNDLLLGIFPIIHDAGKNAMDFVDFYGIFPVGHTIEHREVIRESLWEEMKRRQAWINLQTDEGLGGMEVTADPTWDPERGGPPIRCTWEEFHMHIKDMKFVQYFSSQVRLQRATAIFAEGASQGSGLADWGDQQTKEQMAEVMLQMMRVSDHTARLSGYKGGLMPSTLPSLPGMMVMQDLGGEPVAFRHAFIDRKPKNPESLIYRLKQPDGTKEGRQILFAPALAPETVEVFRRHGLMDLWEMGKTRSGREALQAAADPVESTAYPDALAAAMSTQAPVTKPRLQAAEVVLAMLRHQTEVGQPHMAERDMLASDWWKLVQGDWSKSDSGTPSASTINRACEKHASGDDPLLVRSDDKRWSLTTAGVIRAEQPLTILRGTGVLGQQAKAQVQQAGVDVAALERQAMFEAEQVRIIEESIRAAHADFNGN